MTDEEWDGQEGFSRIEHDIEALEKKIDDLRELDESEAGHAVSVASEIASLQAKERRACQEDLR